MTGRFIERLLKFPSGKGGEGCVVRLLRNSHLQFGAVVITTLKCNERSLCIHILNIDITSSERGKR